MLTLDDVQYLKQTLCAVSYWVAVRIPSKNPLISPFKT